MTERPTAITCARCGETAPVPARGPVPEVCKPCYRQNAIDRKSKARAEARELNPVPATRPSPNDCARCGKAIVVQKRMGPVRKFCNRKCADAFKNAAARERLRAH